MTMTKLSLLGIALLAAVGPEDSTIDRELRSSWIRHQTTPAEEASDEDFLRRVSLDLTGIIPAPEEVLEYGGTPDPARLVDKLLTSDRYSDYWAETWTNLLFGPSPVAHADRDGLFRWLRAKIAGNEPWDTVCQELLAARGRSSGSGAINLVLRYLQKDGAPEDLVVKVSRNFLGIRLNCAQCHDHPDDQWRREDFFGMSAFFAYSRRVEKRTGTNQLEYRELLDDVKGAKDKSYRPIDWDKPVSAVFLSGAEPVSSLYREEFALLVVRSRQFSRNIVNRLWAHLMGKGIVEPVDNFSSKNPPSHPELLEALTDEFIRHRHDVKWLLREIALSKGYRLSSRSHQRSSEQVRWFACHPLRTLPPSVVFDSLARATGLETLLPPYQLRLQREGFVAALGGRFRDEGENPATRQETLEETLRRLTFEGVYQAILPGKGGITDDLLKVDDPKERVERLYFRILSRKPSDEEVKKAMSWMNSPTRCADFAYALLNSAEFWLNH